MSSSHPKPKVDSARKVSIAINKQTIVIIFGTAHAACSQILTPKLYDKDKKEVLCSLRSDFMGQNQAALEVQEGDGPLVVTWGPFDAETNLELEFDHGREENDTGKVIADQMKEFTDAPGMSRSVIPYDDGNSPNKTVVDMTAYVLRFKYLADD